MAIRMAFSCTCQPNIKDPRAQMTRQRKNPLAPLGRCHILKSAGCKWQWQNWHVHQSLANLEIYFLFCIDHYSYYVNELNNWNIQNSPILTVTYKQGLLKERLKEAPSAETPEPDHRSLKPWKVCLYQAVWISHLNTWINNDQDQINWTVTSLYDNAHYMNIQSNDSIFFVINL